MNAVQVGNNDAAAVLLNLAVGNTLRFGFQGGSVETLGPFPRQFAEFVGQAARQVGLLPRLKVAELVPFLRYCQRCAAPCVQGETYGVLAVYGLGFFLGGAGPLERRTQRFTVVDNGNSGGKGFPAPCV